MEGNLVHVSWFDKMACCYCSYFTSIGLVLEIISPRNAVGSYIIFDGNWLLMYPVSHKLSITNIEVAPDTDKGMLV